MHAITRYGLPALGVLAAVLSFVFSGQGDQLGMLLAGIAAVWLFSASALARDRWTGIAVTAALATGVSLYLGHHHVNLTEQAICSVNDVFNCDLVNRSKYAELGGLPIAFIGAGFYAAVLVVALMRKSGRAGFDLAGHLVFVGAVFSAMYSVYLVWASVQVGAWCLFCISLYGANLLLLVGSRLAVRESGTPFADGILPAILGRNDASGGWLVGVGVVMLVGTVALSRSGAAPSPVADGGEASADGAIEGELVKSSTPQLDGTEPILGDPSAPYTIVEWADFQCPGCGAAAPMLHDLVAAQPKVRVLYKYYPLSNVCNRNINRLFHPQACPSAFAAECARQQGRFWELSRLLFLNQEVLDADAINYMAGQVGLDMASFTACTTSDATNQAIQADITAAEAMAIDGTPALFVKGLYGEDWVFVSRGGPEFIGALIDIKEKGGTLPTPRSSRPVEQ